MGSKLIKWIQNRSNFHISVFWPWEGHKYFGAWEGHKYFGPWEGHKYFGPATWTYGNLQTTWIKLVQTYSNLFKMDKLVQT